MAEQHGVKLGGKSPDDDAIPGPYVPFFDNRSSFEAEWAAISHAVNRVFERDRFSHGPVTEELETAMARYTGARFAVATNSGADALQIVVQATGIGRGDEVIVPAFGPFRTASAVHHAGATPVFVDVEPGSYTLAPDAVRAAVTERTRAVIPVHLFAQPADMAELRSVTDRVGIPLIEDSANAVGMRVDGIHTGRLGAAGVLSFDPTGPLGALGDAGMIITDDAQLAERCRLLRHHGRAGEVPGGAAHGSGTALLSGMNSKVDEIQAAVLLARLPRLEEVIARRATLAAYYTERLFPNEDVRTPVILARSRPVKPVWSSYVVQTGDREALHDALARDGVETRAYFPLPLHLQPCFVDLGGRPGEHPIAEKVAATALALPLYPDIGIQRLDLVCTAVETSLRPSPA